MKKLLGLFLACGLILSLPGVAYCQCQGDINEDGVVDGEDITILAENFGNTCQCLPDCTDRECGDDGCGESCGTCGDYQTCNDGNCVADQSYHNLVGIWTPDGTEDDSFLPYYVEFTSDGKSIGTQILSDGYVCVTYQDYTLNGTNIITVRTSYTGDQERCKHSVGLIGVEIPWTIQWLPDNKWAPVYADGSIPIRYCRTNAVGESCN